MLRGQIERCQPRTDGQLLQAFSRSADEPLEPNTVCVVVSTSIGESGNREIVDSQVLPSA
jgi:hypothetical protein